MSAIFVSHASDDLPRVKLLVEALRAEKLSLWWDQEGLHGGDAFMEVIERELAASSCALVCWSRAALQKNRDWVRGEAEKARRRNIALSVLLDPVDLPVPFNVREAISLVDWRGDRSDERFQRLVADIRALVRASSPPPPPPERRSRRALLVSVSACASGFEPLPAAGGNVEELRRVLEQPACDFEVTALPEPDLQGMLDALDAFFGGAGPQDLLLFYYAGQVHLSGTQSLHLTARNSRRDGLKSTTLPFARLAEDYLDPCKADNLLFILDASYGDAARGPIEDALKTYLGHGRSKVLLASGAGPGASAGGWSESQSAFSSRLVRALDLDVSRADTNQDDVVTVGEITVYLHGELSAIHPDLRPIAQNFQAVPGEIVLRGRGSTPPPQLTAAQESFVARLAPELEQGALVPFLGDGIYSGGDLSFFSIAGALVKAAGLPGADKNEVGIATAAESLELQWQDRGRFLRALGDILRDQQSKCGPLPVHKLVADMPAPWVVVTVNYDDLLERLLDEEERPYVVVCHILRSGGDEDADAPGDGPAENNDAGKILVLRSKQHPEVRRDASKAAEICLSEKVPLSKDDRVIYKLLGSPFVNEHPFCRARSLDTVVITERDHIDFLMMLRDPRTSVPSTLASRPLRNKKLLFLEYNLDIWHYRLIGRVFRTDRRSGNAAGSVLLTKDPFVVRTSMRPIEERFWKRFNPDHISMDPTTLVRALRARRSPSP